MAVMALDPSLSRKLLQETADDPHGRCFAGTVRPQKSDHFAAVDRKRNTIDRGQRPKPFDQVPCFDERHLFRSRHCDRGGGFWFDSPVGPSLDARPGTSAVRRITDIVAE